MRLKMLLLGFICFAQPAIAHTVGEARRVVPLTSAAARHADHRAEIDVTVWYPAASGAREFPLVIGPPGRPLFRVGVVAAGAAPARGRRPVILLSHGFGGSARMMGWLGIALARKGYVVIAVDHPGNSAGDMTPVGTIAWWERPRDLIAALRAMELDPLVGRLIDADRVGAAGFSMGAATALALAGGRFDPPNYDRFCAAKPSDGISARYQG